jgi:hypothetical protein
MKAERRPLELPGTNGALPGTMALPMLDHGILAGFVLLGRKFEGSRYRPDEVEVLGWAAHQVGLDLQALRARTLEGEVVGLRQQVALLSKLARESNR